MGAFQEKWQGSRYVLEFLILNLFCWCFGIAVAQEIDALAKAFDSLNFPMEAITCILNMLVFGVTLIRGRLDLENGAREFLGIRRGPKLEEVNGINGRGLTTISIEEQNKPSTEGGRRLEAASVVMLSNDTSNWSMREFMKSCAVDDVHSILLQYQPLKTARNNGTVKDVPNCENRDNHSDQQCKCIIFWTLEEITILLARRMPGTLKRVSNSMCLLPCLNCLNKSCHGCDHGLLHVEGTDQMERLEERDSRGESPAVVCGLLDETALRFDDPGEPICICIPAHNADHDDWTRLLIRSFKSKDAEDRGVRVMASEALQDYLDGERRGNRRRELEYSIGSFIGPRFSEILINIFLAFWFKFDGFSSSFLARRPIRNYLVDSKGSRLAANAFLRKATVQCDADNTHVCQVLTFRGNGLSFITLSSIMAGVNLICFIGWVVLIAFDCGDSAPPLTLPRVTRVVIIIAAISIACIMDGLYMYTNKVFFHNPLDYKVLLVIIWEIACVVAGIVDIIVVQRVGGVPLNWVYSALQLLVWVKWVIGSYILDKYAQESSGYRNDDWKVLIFSSAFLLNAALAGARIRWKPSWPWKKNQLFKHFFANQSHHDFHPPLIQC